MSLALYPTLRGLGWPVKRTLEWDDLSQRVSSGKRLGHSYFTFPINHWELVYNYLKDIPGDPYNSNPPATDLQTIEGFFNQQNGGLATFWWNDLYDNTIAAQNVAIGDGFTKQFQLVRTRGGFTEPVQAPQTWSVYLNGVLQASGFTVSSAGVLAFTAAPGSSVVVSWGGTYYWNVHFEDAKLGYERFMLQLARFKTVRLEQDKL